MAWEGRVREAAYNAPSGTRIVFDFESVSREVNKRTSAFDFPGVDGSYVQDNGASARKYPLRCFFSGEDHDLEATAFEAALLERGIGRLEHPFYGSFDVVPFGGIVRRDDLKSAANQTVVEVTFWTTVGAVYPALRTNTRSEVLAALDGFDVEAAQLLDASLDVSTVASQAFLKATWLSHLETVRSAIASASSAVADAREQVASAQASINAGIDVLIGQPLQLAQQTANLIKAPARIASGIQSRLDGYRDMAAGILGSAAAKPGEAFDSGAALGGRRRQVANDFHASVFFATNAVSGSVLSALETEFVSRVDAIASAEEILSLDESTRASLDGGYRDLTDEDPVALDTGGAHQALQQATAVATGYLVEISFTLLPERRIVLDRPRTIIDVAAEVYGEVDARLDELISNNGLTGSEILELPTGTSVVYYSDV